MLLCGAEAGVAVSSVALALSAGSFLLLFRGGEFQNIELGVVGARLVLPLVAPELLLRHRGGSRALRALAAVIHLVVIVAISWLEMLVRVVNFVKQVGVCDAQNLMLKHGFVGLLLVLLDKVDLHFSLWALGTTLVVHLLVRDVALEGR